MTPAQAEVFHRMQPLGWEAISAKCAGCIEDYLFVTGGKPYRMSARQVADRFGVTPRTVQRWRARLREQSTPALEWDGQPSYGDRREFLDGVA